MIEISDSNLNCSKTMVSGFLEVAVMVTMEILLLQQQQIFVLLLP